MLDNMAITEKEIFTSVIAPEKLDRDIEAELKKNIGTFLRVIPFNIFTNEYYIIYEAMKAAKRYNVIMNYKHFNQILLNNIEKLMKSPNVNLEEIVTDPNDLETSKEELINTSCLVYEELSETELESSRFEFNMELYIKAWTAHKLNQYFIESYKINTEGMQVGRQFLQGPEDADEYYLRNSASVKKLFNLGEDLLESAQVSPEGYSKYVEEKNTKTVSDRVSYTGMDYVDEQIGELGRGTVILLQGPSGSGKTRISSNIAYNAAVNNGENGVFFALEGSTRRAICLFVARHLAEKYDVDTIDDDMIFRSAYPPEYTELVEAAEYDLFNNKDYGKIEIVPSPIYDDEIESVLEDIWDTQFEFSWVVIDYTSLVRPRTKEGVTPMLTELMPKLETSCQSFKGKGYLLILPHQLKSSTVGELIKGSPEATLIGTADSTAVMKSAHIALTIYTNDELKMRDMAQIICTKTRHTMGFPVREVYAKLGVCFFADIPE